MQSLQEKCGVAAGFGPEAAVLTAHILRAEENRGSGSTGLGGTNPYGENELFRAPGPATEVLTIERVQQLQQLGWVAAVGHDRYATSGPVDKHLQPAEAGNSSNQVYLADNGNISNAAPLIQDLYERGIDPGPYNDTDMKTRGVADRVARGASLPEAYVDLFPRLVGAFSTVALGKGPDGKPMIIATKDRHGVRPLFLGRKGDTIVVASETHALDEAEAEVDREIRPGEMITINHNGIESYQLAPPDPKFCMVELNYFSHEDSLFKGVRIGDIRKGFGKRTGIEHGDVDPDSLVVAVPNSGRPHAEGFAEVLGLEYDPDAISKNPQYGRSFMQPTQQLRELLRELKYNFNNRKIKGRPNIWFDDTLIRNTTAPFITSKLYDNGAQSVLGRVGAPPFLYPNYYGIDLPDQSKLAAARMSIEELRDEIKCEHLGYLSIQGMLEVVYELTGEPASNFDLSCYTGVYPIDTGNRNIRQLGLVSTAA